MAVKSLRQLAQRACIKNVKSITDVGDVPYELIRPILIRIESPEQLASLESNCPQLRGVDAEIWKEFIKRDIPKWDKKPHEPRDPKNWAKVYRKLKRDVEKEMLESASKLKKAMDSIKQEKEQNIAQIVSRTKLPMRRPTGRQVVGARAHGIPTQIKRPVYKTAPNSKMVVPTHMLKNKASTTITQAPAAFLADRKRLVATQEAQRQPRPPPSSPKAPTSTRSQPTAPPSLQDREARLRALTQSRQPASQPIPNRPADVQPESPTRSTRPAVTTSSPTQLSSLKRAFDSLESTEHHLPSKRKQVDGERDRKNHLQVPTRLENLPASSSSPTRVRHTPDMSPIKRGVFG